MNIRLTGAIAALAALMLTAACDPEARAEQGMGGNNALDTSTEGEAANETTDPMGT